jgi:hypothetical protein
MAKRGLEELSDSVRNGEPFLTQYENGRYVILQGKHKGYYLDSIPSGYLEYILREWNIPQKERITVQRILEAKEMD